MGVREIQLWAAKDEIDGMVQAKVNRTKGLTYRDALDHVRADHRAHVARKATK